MNNLILILRDMVIIDNVAGRIGQDRPTFGGGMDTRSLRAGSMIMNSQFISNTACELDIVIEKRGIFIQFEKFYLII